MKFNLSNHLTFEHNDLELVADLFELDLDDFEEDEDGYYIGDGTPYDFERYTELCPKHDNVFIDYFEYHPLDSNNNRLIDQVHPEENDNTINKLKERYKIDIPSNFWIECIVRFDVEDNKGRLKSLFYLRQMNSWDDWINITETIKDEDKEGEANDGRYQFVIIPKKTLNLDNVLEHF